MTYCGIMRVEKRKRSDVYGIQIEATRTTDDGREFDRSDIDRTRTADNVILQECPGGSWGREISRQIKDAGAVERKNSVVMLDGVYTASPEFFDGLDDETMEDYFWDCLSFHIREYCGGDPSRILSAVIHLDEKTPHLHVASVPLLESEKGVKLSARDIMGNRNDYRLRQDRFFEDVSSRYGLERGEIREPAETKRHTTKRDWQIANQEADLQRQREQAEKLRDELNDLMISHSVLKRIKDRINSMFRIRGVPAWDYLADEAVFDAVLADDRFLDVGQAEAEETVRDAVKRATRHGHSHDDYDER